MGRFVLLLLALALVGCEAQTVRGRPLLDGRPLRLVSNILRRDYAGSAACAKCHPDIFARWVKSPMHNMNRLPAGATIATPFADGVFRFKDDRVVLSEQGGARFLRIESPRFGDHLFRISKVIGGHHREDFAGLEVAQATADALVIGDPHRERVLPISYMLGSRTFRYKGYSVLSPERPGLKPGAVWNRTCIFCHNTVPYLSTVLGSLAGPGVGPYQGEVVDALLPVERRQALVVTDEAGLAQAVQDELGFLHGSKSSPAAPPTDGRPLAALLRQGVQTTRTLFNEAHLVELGIGCESCHLGSREHVEDSRLRPSLQPRSRFLATRPAQPSPAQQINRACARCHQVLFSRYPYTWEGGGRRQSPGGSNINSGEGRDLLLGGCASQLSCVGCHDPHADPPSRQRELQALEGPAGSAVCLRCHEKYAPPAALRAHTHHDPAGPGSLCLSCHMAKKNMTLDSQLGRYHRIGSPTAVAKVEGDRPLECALCHTDRSVASLVDDMERLYGQHYDRRALEKLYGDLGQNVLLATLLRGKAHEQAVAVALLGQARRRDAAPLIGLLLTHPLPALRYYAVQALEQILGTPAPLDLHQENAQIESAARAWLAQSGVTLPPSYVVPAAAPAAKAADPADDE